MWNQRKDCKKDHQFLLELFSKKRLIPCLILQILMWGAIPFLMFLQRAFQQIHASTREMLGDQKVKKWGQDSKLIEKAKKEKKKKNPTSPLSTLAPRFSVSPLQFDFSNLFMFSIGSIQHIVACDNNFENSDMIIDWSSWRFISVCQVFIARC